MLFQFGFPYEISLLSKSPFKEALVLNFSSGIISIDLLNLTLAIFKRSYLEIGFFIDSCLIRVV